MKFKKIHKGFTLIEMLVVLLIISVLILLFIPNLTRQKESVTEKGNAAIVKVVETQMEMYMLDKNTNIKPDVQTLVPDYLTQDQANKYKEIPNK